MQGVTRRLRRYERTAKRLLAHLVNQIVGAKWRIFFRREPRSCPVVPVPVSHKCCVGLDTPLRLKQMCTLGKHEDLRIGRPREPRSKMCFSVWKDIDLGEL